jgi:hypothetical protein
MRGLLAVITDAAMVLVFVVIGRASHHASGDLAGLSGLAGIASTAWPFLTGLATGELAIRGWRRPAALVPTGVVVWLSTVAVGMALRVIAGQGTAVAFIAVALGFLGLFLLGWRAVVQVAATARTRDASRT